MYILITTSYMWPQITEKLFLGSVMYVTSISGIKDCTCNIKYAPFNISCFDNAQHWSSTFPKACDITGEAPKATEEKLRVHRKFVKRALQKITSPSSSPKSQAAAPILNTSRSPDTVGSPTISKSPQNVGSPINKRPRGASDSSDGGKPKRLSSPRRLGVMERPDFRNRKRSDSDTSSSKESGPSSPRGGDLAPLSARQKPKIPPKPKSPFKAQVRQRDELFLLLAQPTANCMEPYQQSSHANNIL